MIKTGSILLIFLSTFSQNILAGNIEKGFEALDIYNYFEA